MHSIITLLICNAAYCSPCFAIQSLVLHYFCFLHKNSKEIFQFILCSVSFLWFSKAVWIWFFFSVPHRSLRQILLSLPPILDMLFLLLFIILIFAMLGKLMIMRMIVLLFIQNISKLISYSMLTSMMFLSSNKMCLFPSREDQIFSLEKCFSSFQRILIFLCIRRRWLFSKRMIFLNYQLKNAKPLFRQTPTSHDCLVQEFSCYLTTSKT